MCLQKNKELAYSPKLHASASLFQGDIVCAEELGDCTANAKLLQFDRHHTLPVPEMPLQLMGTVLDESVLSEQLFTPS